MLLYIAFLLIPALAVAQPPLDPAYHDLQEIRVDLLSLAEDFPDIVLLDTIGYGSFYNEPIWLVKISDNVREHESEPALLYIGQVHSEEVVGVELILEIMSLLTDNADDQEIQDRVEGLELYFIPTLNPDGLSVVHNAVDVTFRKNCRDNIGDGEFRFHRGLGRDSSGVDLNRNFGLHWNRGDTLFFHNGAADAYNYYRGLAPFSEPETIALRDLMLGTRFLYSISYHSSRSGRNSELVIGPWSWEGKRPPDDASIFTLASALASRLPRQGGAGTYEPVRATMRVGQEQDWAYQQTGCYLYMVEIGAEIQPDSLTMRQLISDNLSAAFFLMDLALGDSSIVGNGTIDLTVRDSATDEPLAASIGIGNSSPLLAPKISDHVTGQFRQLLPAGNYPLLVTKFGYVPYVDEGIQIPNGGIREHEVVLQKLPTHFIKFETVDDSTDEQVVSRLSISSVDDIHSLDLMLDPDLAIELPEGFHTLLFRAENYVPKRFTFEVRFDTTISIRLSHGSAVFVEDFEEDQGWQQGGLAYQWGIAQVAGRSCLTESLNGPYEPNANTWLMIETELSIEPRRPAMVELIHIPYFEPGSDFGRFEVYSARAGVWLSLASFQCFASEQWDTTYISLEGLNLEGIDLRFRFKIEADASVEEDGWNIDRLAIIYADSPMAANEKLLFPPQSLSLTAFPSPTNGAVRVALNLPVETTGDLTLYDALGRETGRIWSGKIAAGQSQFSFDRPDLPSGQYYIVFRDENASIAPSKITSFLLLR